MIKKNEFADPPEQQNPPNSFNGAWSNRIEILKHFEFPADICCQQQSKTKLTMLTCIAEVALASLAGRATVNGGGSKQAKPLHAALGIVAAQRSAGEVYRLSVQRQPQLLKKSTLGFYLCQTTTCGSV